MRKFFLTVFLCALTLGGCKEKNTDASGGDSPVEPFDKDTSYAMGLEIGTNLKENKIIPDAGQFYRGFKDALKGGKTRFDIDEAEEKINEAITARRDKENEKLKQQETDYLAENSKKPGIIVTDSGLQYEVITEGSGAKPTADDMVQVNYRGSLTDGTEFDSSYSRGQPAEFPLSAVIPGWIEGIQLMSVGSNYKFYIPSELAYGSSGGGPIPPYSALIFEVELLDIIKQ